MLVVVLYDLLIGHVPVVGQYTAVCVLAVENVKLLSLLLALPLHDEAAMLHVLETLEGERLHVVLRSPRWESITEDRIRSNMSKTKNIPPKALIFSDFCCTFAMSLMILLGNNHVSSFKVQYQL